MRIVHFSAYDTKGGAARGSYALHRELLKAGEDSLFVVKRKLTHDPTVVAPNESRPWWRLKSHGFFFWDQSLLRNYPQRDTPIFTPALHSSGLLKTALSLRPDVLQLHWLESGMFSPRDLEGCPVPIVWTLRDLWPVTGGCHYPGECTRFTDGCGACPQLGSSDSQDLSRKMAKLKKGSYAAQNIQLVCTSHWMKELAERSAIRTNHSIRVIPNAVDDQVFRPQDKAALRARYSVEPSARVIVFGAVRALSDSRKGFAELKQAMARLDPGIQLIIFGEEGAAPQAGIRNMGLIQEDRVLAEIYGLADVVVVPSREEAFGKTAVEAMACGVPVVCFDVGGLKDIVDHRENGYRARPFDAEDLAEGIRWVMDPAKREALREKALAKVRLKFLAEAQAAQYRELYAGLIR